MTFAKKARNCAISMLITFLIDIMIFLICVKFNLLPYLFIAYVMFFRWMGYLLKNAPIIQNDDEKRGQA